MADKALISQRLAGLTPEKRQLLRKLLEAKTKTLQPRNPQERVPLTYSQQRLWIMDQLVPGIPIYNETNFIPLKFALDVEILRRAVNEIIRRHESLRTVIKVIDEEPTQQVKPSLVLEIPLIDLRQSAPEARVQEALRLAAEQGRIPFKLEAGPLFRAALYRVDDESYLFVLTMHHMICDGWSMRVFFEEFCALYEAFATGQPSPLPELKIQYPDFALWQRKLVNNQTLGPHLAYWRKQLADLPTLELPTDHPRPAEFSFRGARHPMLISGALCQSLLSLCKREGVTPHILLITALYVLLHRYSGQEDIAVGTPVVGRSRQELESLIGFFINTLVIRADLSGNPRFLDLLARVRKISVEGLEHQDVPFEYVVEELQPVRDKSRNPLVQIVFQVFQTDSAFQADSATDGNPDLSFLLTPVETSITKFDLYFQLILAKNEILGHVEYSTDLFDASSIERLTAHFSRLLESIVADPNQLISRLAILSEDEERRLLIEWNATEAEYPRDSSIPAIFEAQARSSPEHIAVRFADTSLTYRELDERADRMAAKLLALGIKRGDVVGLLIERSLELPVAMLGLAKCGAISVPLDPNYPVERLSYLISDSGAKLVLTLARFKEIIAALETEALLIEDALSDAGQTAKPETEVKATDVACLLYTSGTTGQPKGVALTHRNILRLIKDVRYARFTSDDLVLQFAAITFDASAFEIWGALLNGATLVIYPPGTPSLDELGGFIKKAGITLLFLTTSLFRQMAELNAEDLRSVRQLVAGGEALPASLAKAAWKELPRTRIINGYGPTECTTFACTYPITNTETIGDSVPIGKPIENTTIFILDNYGNPVPVGIPGEIYIGGDGVTEGYWNRPEMTALSFVPDPFGQPGSRMYRTGDIGKYRDDGNILFLGRRDRQIKLSGYRIELAEVEAAIAAHPDVSGVAVLLSENGDKRLTAYTELSPERQLTFSELREYLSKSLPHYMIPTQLEVLDKLPLTSSGKVDYRALSRLKNSPVTSQNEYVPPRSAVEKLLAEIWKEILKAERIGVTDNFFDLGGQSLIATRLLSRVRDKLQVELTMRQFFDNPTITGLAALLSQDEHQVKQAKVLLALDVLSRKRTDQPDLPTLHSGEGSPG